MATNIITMTCDECGIVITEPADEIDGSFQKCGACERWLCVDCLRGMYMDRDVSASDIEQITDRYGAGGFIKRYEDDTEWLCPECYNDRA